MNKANQLMITRQLIRQTVRDYSLRRVLSGSHFTTAVSTTATVENISWEDIEEEVSIATGTVKLSK